MKNNSASNFTLGGLSFAVSLAFLKRLTLVTVQASLDVAVYWGCLNVVRVFWTAGVYPLWAKREIFFCGVLLVCFCFSSLYSFRNWMFWDEMREVLKASVAMSLVVVVYLFALKLQMSRGIVVIGTALFVPACLLVRYFVRRFAAASGFLRTRVLIVGAGGSGELYAKKVAKHPFMGCKVLGFLDDDPQKLGLRVAGSPVLGSLDDFGDVARELNVDEVVVAIPTAKRDLLVRVLNIVEMRVKRVSYIPDMYMLTTFSASMRDIDGLPLISASQGLLNPMNRLIKSVMDYAGGLLALILFSPVFLYVAWKIKHDDGGTVLFKQNRVGRNMELFKVYKFRTMVPGAEKMLLDLLKDEKTRREYEVAFKFKDDPRTTKVGRFLRKSSIDEIPQIFNILKGEMSLVGPRPFVPWEIETRYGETAGQIYRVKPGLTGLWQVGGRSDIMDFQQSRDLDLFYIRNWSPWLDIVIMLRTVRILLDATGAY